MEEFVCDEDVRLKQRELGMHRAFDDATFRQFVMSDELLARREMLAKTLDDWLHADLQHAAGLARAYLPPNAAIRATVYPVIKPAKNSVVFERNAIFMYVDAVPREEFEATIAHEMHHIGYGADHPDEGSGRLVRSETVRTRRPLPSSWKMAVVIEKTLGRDALIAARAVRLSGERLPSWPERLAAAFD